MLETDEPQEILRELQSGEKLLWTGRPRQDLVLRPVDKVCFPSGLFLGLLLGVAIYYSTGSLSFLFILFLSAGIYTIPFIKDKIRRQKTCYIVTNRRILIIYGIFSCKSLSLDLHSLPGLLIEKGKNKGETIIFGALPRPWWEIFGEAVWPPYLFQKTPRFELSGDARTVYDLIRKAQSEALLTHPPKTDPEVMLE